MFVYANPSKFQMITFGLGTTATILCVKGHEMIERQLVATSSSKLLEIYAYADELLNFDHYELSCIVCLQQR